MATVFLSFGANLGDRLATFEAAEKLLKDLGVTFLKWSSVYETEPVSSEKEDLEQPWFYNRVAKVETTHAPEALLCLFKDIEVHFGRTNHSFSRPIDIDILFYDDKIVDTESLQIPHPRAHLRRFVLEPLAEIAPTFEHPTLHKAIEELLKECTDSSTVRML